MKFARIEFEGKPIAALHDGQHWYNATKAVRDWGGGEAARGLLSLIKQQNLTAAFCERVRLAETDRPGTYLLPEPEGFLLPYRPGKIVAIGRNYRAHAAELDNQVPSEPMFFGKSPTACIAPDAPILLRDWYGRVDHEGELACVIGKTAKDIAPEDAREYIAAYTLVNDVTARAMQKGDAAKGHPWFRAKNLDTFCPLGPVLVLPEALGWPVEADIEVRVNDTVRQQSNTRNFIFALPELIAAVTRHMTLEPGDIIATGTPEGVAPLADGDIVEVTVPDIGTLRNPVRNE